MCEAFVMRNLKVVLVLAAAVLACSAGTASAQSDTATVTYTISAVTLVEIGGDVSLTINDVNSIGGGLKNDTQSTTYAITNNAGSKKMVGKINSDMPSNTVLTLTASAPASGASAGAVTLTSSNQNLVTGIGAVNQTGVALSFGLSANVNAALVNGASKTLTLTLVDES
jgi:hypothetical protein